MILDGYSIGDKKIVTFPDDAIGVDSQIQPNGVDLRVEKIYRVHGKALIPREGKAEADFVIQEHELKDGYWKLEPRDQAMYYADFQEEAYLLDGHCGILITRSSLVRAGIDIQAGLWDCGWKGKLGCTLRIYNDVTIEYGARLAQFMVYESKFRGARYEGRYQGTTSQTAITS